MLEAFFDWLERRQHRWHIANVIIITLILTIADSEGLSTFIGGMAIAVMAIFGAIAARKVAQDRQILLHPFAILLIWLPGAFALALAAGGLWVAVAGGYKALGLSVFALHGALLMRLASDQMEGRLPTVLELTDTAHSTLAESAT